LRESAGFGTTPPVSVLGDTGMPVDADCSGTHDSALKLLIGSRYLRPGQRLLEDR